MQSLGPFFYIITISLLYILRIVKPCTGNLKLNVFQRCCSFIASYNKDEEPTEFRIVLIYISLIIITRIYTNLAAGVSSAWYFCCLSTSCSLPPLTYVTYDFALFVLLLFLIFPLFPLNVKHKNRQIGQLRIELSDLGSTKQSNTSVFSIYLVVWLAMILASRTN